MKLTLENVFAQEQLDKRKLTSRVNEQEQRINMQENKLSELYAATKVGDLNCLTACEIRQIIDDYIGGLTLDIASIDDSTLGVLTFGFNDPELPPQTISLCQHVQYCETDTTLTKASPLVLTYTGEGATQTINLTDWFTAGNVIWSGTMSGHAQSTVQTIIDEIVIDIDDDIDCLYFTGSGGAGAFLLSLDDLTDVNTLGAPVTVGDYLRFDGNNWVPTSSALSFSCASLNTCSVDSFADVDTSGSTLKDVLTYNGSVWRPLNLSSVGNKVLRKREKFADVSMTNLAEPVTYSLTLANPGNIPMTVMYVVSWSAQTVTEGLTNILSAVTIDGAGSLTPNDYGSTVSVGASTEVGAVGQITDFVTSIPVIDFKTNTGTDTTVQLTLSLSGNTGTDTVYFKNVQIAIIGISTLTTEKSIA